MKHTKADLHRSRTAITARNRGVYLLILHTVTGHSDEDVLRSSKKHGGRMTPGNGSETTDSSSARPSPKGRPGPSAINGEIERLEAKVSAMINGADATLFRALEIQKLISQMRSVVGSIEASGIAGLRDRLEHCDALLREGGDVLAKAISTVRLEYRSLRPILERLVDRR